jgi:hypothetical protein
MKSVTIKDNYGNTLIRVSESKTGDVNVKVYQSIEDTVTIDVRDCDNKKVYFVEKK